MLHGQRRRDAVKGRKEGKKEKRKEIHGGKEGRKERRKKEEDGGKGQFHEILSSMPLCTRVPHTTTTHLPLHRVGSIIVSPPLSPSPRLFFLFFFLLGDLHAPATLRVKVIQRAEALVSPMALDCVVPRPARPLWAIAPLIEPRKRGKD